MDQFLVRSPISLNHLMMFVGHWLKDSHYLHIIKLNRNKSKPKIDVLGANHWPKKWSFIDVGDGNVYGSNAARNTAVIFYDKLHFNYCAFHELANSEVQKPTDDCVFRCRQSSLTVSKGHGFWFVIGGFRSVLCVSVFQGSLPVIAIMIDGSEKRNCGGGFWTLEFSCLWKAQ